VTTPAVNKTSNTTLGALLTMLAMLCFAGMDATSKWLVADYPVGQLMAIRCALVLLFTFFIVRRLGARRVMRSSRPGLQIVRSLIWVVESAIFVLAFKYLPLADAHALASTSPLVVIAMAIAFLGERSSPARWIAVTAAFVGVLVILRPGFRGFDWPLLLPLGGAVLWAGYQILTRLAQRSDSPETSMMWSSLIAFVAAALVGWIDWHWPTPWAWTLMVFVAVLGTIAHYALIKAFDVAEAGAVQPYGYSMLIWVTALGIMLFGDIPDGWTIAGAAIVVASGLFAWRHDRKAGL
jgi:drug/metabolite transporter (DMT)-like permease